MRSRRCKACPVSWLLGKITIEANALRKALGQQQRASEGDPCQQAQSRREAQEEGEGKSGCPSGRLGRTDGALCRDSLLCGQRRGLTIRRAWLWRLGGLSPQELLGLHSQMPIQLRGHVVGHLADLLLYKPNGVLRDLVL